MKKILLLVTGMSPAIVTETVYGLAVNPANGRSKWIPDEIHIISTEHGLVQIKDRLLKQGSFEKLLRDYDLPTIRFDESQLYPIVDEQGHPQYDLKTPDDNERAANLICEKVREFTQDNNIELHVSIAGGRKTMGFYIGYALSLYGRANDHMSHVLVEAPFDETKVPDFYYPTPYDTFVKDFSGQSWNAKDAKIWLSYIPFVRLRHLLPEQNLLSKKSFSEVVGWINALTQEPTVKLDIRQRKIWLHGMLIPFKKPDLAFYMMFLSHLQGYVSPPKRDINRPIPEQSTVETQRLAEDFLSQLERLHKTVDARTEHSLREGMFEQYFSSRQSNTNQKIIETLGHKLALPYLIDVIGHQMIKGRNAGVYALSLKKEQIDIIEG